MLDEELYVIMPTFTIKHYTDRVIGIVQPTSFPPKTGPIIQRLSSAR